jgi:hypothetical protein
MKRINLFFGIVLAVSVLAWPAQARTAAPAGAKEYIVSPKTGDVVTNPVTVVFGLKGMGVAPAGVEKENTGHHHLLIDTELPSDLSQPVPADDHHRHFGGGQTETEVTLSPGTHTLQLLLADFAHVPLNPPVMSDKITVTVK